MSEGQAPAIVAQPHPAMPADTLGSMVLGYQTIVARKKAVQDILEHVMQPDVHYGKIPGCGDKPSLLKPGAEAISSTFQLSPRYTITKTEIANGHREYEIVCDLYSLNGAFVGSGVGSATTMESKYRFRTGGGEVSEIPVPKAYWDNRKDDPRKAAKALRDAAHAGGLEGEKFGTKKDEAGVWRITTVAQDAKVEHDNPADYYNTVLKMAKKRAFVDAILTTTGASDIFTQDIEDDPGLYGGKSGAQAGSQPTAPTPGAAPSGPSANDQMGDLPYGDKSPKGPATPEQTKAINNLTKKKGIAIEALFLALSEGNSFGRQVLRASDLTGEEAGAVIGWLNGSDLDYLAKAA